MLPIPMHWKDNHVDNDNNGTYSNIDSNKKQDITEQRNETI
jgi:hypothetical protein